MARTLVLLNVVWGTVDVLLLVARARGVRPGRASAIALSTAALALGVESGFSFMRFHVMRAASFAIFLHVPLILLAIAWLSRRRPRRAWSCAFLATGLVVVAADAFLYEPHALVTSRYEAKIGVAARAVVMSDFQATQIGAYEQSVLARVAALDPDLVLLAGDYIQVYGEE